MPTLSARLACRILLAILESRLATLGGRSHARTASLELLYFQRETLFVLHSAQLYTTVVNSPQEIWIIRESQPATLVRSSNRADIDAGITIEAQYGVRL